jgi:hypothetical protein
VVKQCTLTLNAFSTFMYLTAGVVAVPLTVPLMRAIDLGKGAIQATLPAQKEKDTE